MLVLDHLAYKYPGTGSFIFSNLSFELHPGQLGFLVGPSGSGKTTLLRLLNHQLSPTKGHIRLNNRSLNYFKNKPTAIRTLHQSPAENLFLELTVLENYMLYAQPLGHQDKTGFIASLANYHPNLPSRLHMPASRLSGGEKQSLALALALLVPPALLLLDEHTSALPPTSARRLMEITASIVKQQAVTCLAITHQLEVARSYGAAFLDLEKSSGIG